jgi:hypothetical protein
MTSLPLPIAAFITLGALSTGTGQLLARYKSSLARGAGVIISSVFCSDYSALEFSASMHRMRISVCTN